MVDTGRQWPNTSSDPDRLGVFVPEEPQCECLWLFYLQGNAVSGPASCPHRDRVSVLHLWAPPTSACHCHGNKHHLSVACPRASLPHANRKW